MPIFPLRYSMLHYLFPSSSNIALDFQYSWCVFPSFTDQDFMDFLDENLSIQDEASAKTAKTHCQNALVPGASINNSATSS